MKIKGSLTVEASLVMPIILAVFVILIYLSFYLHDYAVLTSCAYEVVISGNQKQSEAEIKKEIETKIKELLTNRLLGTSNVDSQIDVDNKKIKLVFEGVFKVPGMNLINHLLPMDDMMVKTEASVYITRPVEFIRNCRMIEQVKNKIEE